ncbi:hypothetical protein [Pseudochelatococcus sp. G4_1912]|uniref:hypothetical protein n=1 Tax=Pseudochelatococcus sp. G4_1912 TaxID=3114288 RepID=UPI0039C7014E
MVHFDSSNKIKSAESTPPQNTSNINDPQLPAPSQSGAPVVKAAGEVSPFLSDRIIVQLSTSAFKGLEHLNSSALERVRQAKSPEEARVSVGIWNRILDFILPKMLRSNAGEAAEHVFNAIYKKSPSESFQLLRMQLRPEERHHLKLDTTKEGQVTLKMGKFALNSADINNPAAKEKIESVLIAAKTSDILIKRNPSVDAEAELQEIANSFSDKNPWKKFEDIARVVLSKTPPLDCMGFPVARLTRSESSSNDTTDTSTYYDFKIDDQLISSSAANSQDARILAVKSEISILVQKQMRSITEQLSIENFRNGNIQCMAEKNKQAELTKMLDDPICQKNNLISITDNTAIEGETPTFKATFKDADSGKEVSFNFSNRSSQKGEFRGTRLQEALRNTDYINLRELAERGYGTAEDLILVAAISAVSQEISNALDSIAPMTHTVTEIKTQLQTAETNQEKSWKALKNSKKVIRKYRKNSNTPSLKAVQSVEKRALIYQKAKADYQKAKAEQGAAEADMQAAMALRAEILQIKVENTTLGQLWQRIQPG